MKEYHEMKIAGLTRQLKLCPLGETMQIAAFVIFGDVELTVACSKELLEKAPGFDVLLTAESKGIPLAYEMARQSGKPYVVARKTKKLYMYEPVSVNVKSITTEDSQVLILDKKDIDDLAGKRVLVVDDVVSLGDSIHSLVKLVEAAQGIVASKMTILAEGDARNRQDIIYLESLPLFDLKGDIL